MRVLSRAAIACPGDQAEFRSQEMNLPGRPSAEMICNVDSTGTRCTVPPSPTTRTLWKMRGSVLIRGEASAFPPSAFGSRIIRVEFHAALAGTPISRGSWDVGWCCEAHCTPKLLERSVSLSPTSGRLVPIKGFPWERSQRPGRRRSRDHGRGKFRSVTEDPRRCS